jgi:predicted NUDIX family NTP pyrophosphohydrolase
MSPRISAALAVVREVGGVREVLLVHPGGPFWANKDEGAWSLPKGEIEPGEEALSAALREWTEETGFAPPPSPHVPLGEIRQKSGKRVVAFAARGEVDPATLRSNEIEIEWPPRSGRKRKVPEIDRAMYFALVQAKAKVNEAQRPLVERALGASFDSP